MAIGSVDWDDENAELTNFYSNKKLNRRVPDGPIKSQSGPGSVIIAFAIRLLNEFGKRIRGPIVPPLLTLNTPANYQLSGVHKASLARGRCYNFHDRFVYFCMRINYQRKIVIQIFFPWSTTSIPFSFAGRNVLNRRFEWGSEQICRDRKFLLRDALFRHVFAYQNTTTIWRNKIVTIMESVVPLQFDDFIENDNARYPNILEVSNDPIFLGFRVSEESGQSGGFNRSHRLRKFLESRWFWCFWTSREFSKQSLSRFHGFQTRREILKDSSRTIIFYTDASSNLQEYFYYDGSNINICTYLTFAISKMSIPDSITRRTFLSDLADPRISVSSGTKLKMQDSKDVYIRLYFEDTRVEFDGFKVNFYRVLRLRRYF